MGPAPHGAGGLKFDSEEAEKAAASSRPARGGWIEIRAQYFMVPPNASRPARGGWIEIAYSATITASSGSRPARGGWIEMTI